MGTSNLKGSSLGKHSLREGVKLSELDCGILGLSLLLDRGLPQLVTLVLHLLEDLGMAGINRGVNRGKQGGNILLSGAAGILDLADSAIQGVDGLPRLLFSLGHGDGVASDLILEWAGDLAQGAKGVARVLFNSTLGTDSVVARLAVGVDFVTDVLLAAGNPLHGGSSGKGVLKGDLLVSRGDLGFLVTLGASWAKVLCALNTTHGRVSFLTNIALDHPVDVSRVGLGRLDQGVDEGVAGEECNPAETGEGEGSTALVAAEVRRLGLGGELLGLKAAKTEGVQAGKGAGVIEGLFAHWALDQFVD